MTVASYSPYFPDLSPCDFFIFPELKIILKGKRFVDGVIIEKLQTVPAYFKIP
jgi:hypothetical protein